MGAPAAIQVSRVLIWAVVQQARGFVPVVEHSSGIRAFVQPVTLAFTALLITLLAASLGTISFIVLHIASVFDAFGDAFTIRAYSPVVFRRST